MLLLKQPLHVFSGFQEIQLGSGQAQSLRSMVEKIRDLCKSDTLLDFASIPYRTGEVMYARANPEILKSLGWDCHYSLETGLTACIEDALRHKRACKDEHEEP